MRFLAWLFQKVFTFNFDRLVAPKNINASINFSFMPVRSNDVSLYFFELIYPKKIFADLWNMRQETTQGSPENVAYNANILWTYNEDAKASFLTIFKAALNTNANSDFSCVNDARDNTNKTFLCYQTLNENDKSHYSYHNTAFISRSAFHSVKASKKLMTTAPTRNIASH